jgi:hypothetical protein
LEKKYWDLMVIIQVLKERRVTSMCSCSGSSKA